jgi:hypothetical protein
VPLRAYHPHEETSAEPNPFETIHPATNNTKSAPEVPSALSAHESEGAPGTALYEGTISVVPNNINNHPDFGRPGALPA